MKRTLSRHAWIVFALALCVRLVHLGHVAPTPFFEVHRSFAESDMHMFDAWSARLAAGDWLGREVPHPLYRWQLDLAPEARWRDWYGDPQAFYKAPLYPYLVAALRALFGDPMLPLALLQCLASALAAALLVSIGDRLFSPPAGFAAGLLFALYAPAVHFDVLMLRGPWITLLALVATSALMRLASQPSPRRALVCGAWVGVALLVNEGFSLVPVLVLACLPFWTPTRRQLGSGAAAFLGGLALALLPLVLRNLAVGAPPLQLAVTGSVVYAVFNAHGASPWAFEIHPQVLTPLMDEAGAGMLSMAAACVRTFPDLASLVAFYAERLLGLLAPFENPDNANFYYAAILDPLLGVLPAYGTLLPLAFVGLALCRGRLARLLPLAPFSLALLAAILLTTTLSRYRVVLAVFLFPFAGLALATATRAANLRDWRRLLRLAVGVAAVSGVAWLAERRLGSDGKLSGLRYRPAEFYLVSAGWTARGEPERATAEMWSLVRHNRDPRTQAWALLQAARLQGSSGRRERANETLGLAIQAGGRDAALLLGVGDVRRELLGDAPGAAAAYADALALRPGPALEAQLQRRLGGMAEPAPVQ